MTNICKKHILALPLVIALVLVSLTVAAQAAEPLKVVRDFNVPVPMMHDKDKVILRANVFQPDQPGPYPALVIRSLHVFTCLG